MRILLAVVLLAAVLCGTPTEFDLRAQSSIIRYADFSLKAEGICSGYAWAKELAQILSNAISLKQKQKITLSAQHILECTRSNSSLCYSSTKQNILDGIQVIKKDGITTDTCYLNRPMQYPRSCSRFCHNGQQFDFIFKADFKQYENIKSVFQLYRKSDNVIAFAIVKIDDSFNYYSSLSNNVLNDNPTDIYQYRVAEIVGWKKNQSQAILRLGSGTEWGYNGFIDLNLAKYSKLIDSYYVIDLSAYAPNIRKELS